MKTPYPLLATAALAAVLLFPPRSNAQNSDEKAEKSSRPSSFHKEMTASLLASFSFASSSAPKAAPFEPFAAFDVGRLDQDLIRVKQRRFDRVAIPLSLLGIGFIKKDLVYTRANGFIIFADVHDEMPFLKLDAPLSIKGKKLFLSKDF